MFGHMNEPFALSRDVKAIIIPAGEQLTLREGTNGFITQALGGSFTVYVEGNLFRIAGADAPRHHRRDPHAEAHGNRVQHGNQRFGNSNCGDGVRAEPRDEGNVDDSEYRLHRHLEHHRDRE